MSLELSGTTPAIKGVAGSVSAPAITGDDADTGISFPSANTIKFSTGGVERMSITNSGVTGTGIGAGKVLQVVESADFSTQTSTSSTSFQDTGITATITPTATSSKVLVLSCGDTFISGTGYNCFGEVRLIRASTEIGRVDHAYDSANSSFGARLSQSFCINRLDSPTYSLGDSITYKIQIRVAATGYSATIKSPSKNYGSSAEYYAGNRIQLLEVGA